MAAVQGTELPKPIDVAIAHHHAGRLADAAAAYRQLLESEPGNLDALHLLGVVAIQRGEHHEAIDLISQSLAGNPENFNALNHLGEAYRGINAFEEATTCFERALELKGDFFQAYNNLGTLYQAQGRLDQSIACYQKALAINPGYAEALVNLGNVFQAVTNWNGAIECYERALALRPDFAEALFNHANLLKLVRRFDESIPFYERTVTLRPDFALGHLALGRAYQEIGEREKAIESFQRACTLDPEDANSRWGLVISELALVHDRPGDAVEYRAAFARGLSELDVWFNADRARNGFSAVGTMQPFYLPYSEENNRDLLGQFGQLSCRLAKHWQDDQRLVVRKRSSGNRIRLGIASAHVCDHSVWNSIVKGWCQHLDPQRIELHIFSLGQTRDQHTDYAKSRAARFVQGANDVRRWAAEILAEPLDVLVYPEVGMDPMVGKLATLRLAPVQVAAWGHPETTGLPTIDYYLSAAQFEPGNAEDNYTERLIRLPNLGCCYSALDAPAGEVALETLGIDRDSPILICPGTPFKYASEHDSVLVEIARGLGRCQFVFFKYPRGRLSQRLMSRLGAAFAAAGLDFAKFAVEISWLSREHFYSLMRQADLYVDTIGFSGFNTAMQAIECGLPVVTREGRFMRGRFASGILRELGMPDLIAGTDRDYAALIVALARDPVRLRDARERIRQARNRLFDDVASVRALEEFIVMPKSRDVPRQRL